VACPVSLAAEEGGNCALGRRRVSLDAIRGSDVVEDGIRGGEQNLGVLLPQLVRRRLGRNALDEPPPLYLYTFIPKEFMPLCKKQRGDIAKK